MAAHTRTTRRGLRTRHTQIRRVTSYKPVLALLASSVHSNVDTCLQVMQYQIDLADVQAPAAAGYKTTAERLMLHKNTVQYRIRKAAESLGRPVGDDRHDVELALQASHWLGASVLQPAAADRNHHARQRVR
jgi:PucR C-terminal helix-turn-helix domain